MHKISALHLSALLHLSLVLGAGLIFLVLNYTGTKTLNIPLKVIENAQSFSTTLKLQPPKLDVAPKPIETKPEARKVFGTTRKSIQAAATDSTAIEVKAGNTVAKEQDNLKLDANDVDSLPIPADDFLITEDVVNIARPKNENRTDEARKQGYTGVATVEVLIDEKGVVREARAINPLPYGLSERAVELVYQYRFRPAKIKDQAVAVRRVLEISFKAGS